MIKLYKFDKEKCQWVHVDYGVKGLEDKYTAQGYVIVHF